MQNQSGTSHAAVGKAPLEGDQTSFGTGRQSAGDWSGSVDFDFTADLAGHATD